MMNCPCARYEIFERLDWAPAETSGPCGRQPAQARPALASIVASLSKLGAPLGRLLLAGASQAVRRRELSSGHPTDQPSDQPPDQANYINEPTSPGETQSQLEMCRQGAADNSGDDELDNTLVADDAEQGLTDSDCQALGGSKYCRITNGNPSVSCCCRKQVESGNETGEGKLK